MKRQIKAIKSRVGMFWRKHTVEFFFNVKTGWRTIYED